MSLQLRFGSAWGSMLSAVRMAPGSMSFSKISKGCESNASDSQRPSTTYVVAW
jgi:hypothetical protein